MATWHVILVFCALYGTCAEEQALQLDEDLPNALNLRYYTGSCNNTNIPSVDDCGNLTAACVDFRNFIVSFQRHNCTKNFTKIGYLIDMSSDFLMKYSSSHVLKPVVAKVDIFHALLKLFSSIEETEKGLQEVGTYSPVGLGKRTHKLKDVVSEHDTHQYADNVLKKIGVFMSDNNELAAKFNLTNTHSVNVSREWNKTIETLNILKDTHEEVSSFYTVTFIIIPIMLAVLFLVGISGNLLLALIFIANKDMRTTCNTMLINLIAADCLSLIFNLPFSYATNLDTWTTTPFTCQIFFFLQTLTIAGSTYCVVVLSFERYRAISSSVIMRSKSLSPLLTTSVFWLVIFLYSAVNFAFVTASNQFCVIESVFKYINFVLIFVIPVGIILLLHCMAALILRKSITNNPGERMGKEQMMKNRTLASRALVGLAVLFSISYFPSYLKIFLDLNERISSGRLTGFILFYSQFLNSALNPVILYFLSSRFRELFNYYLCCKYRKSAQTNKTSPISVKTSV